MSKFNTANRNKGLFTAAYSKKTLLVSRNAEHVSGPHLFLEMRDSYGGVVYASFTIEDAKAIRDAIDSVIEDYAAIKVEQEEALTGNSRLLDSLPIGSVIQVNNETTRWYKKRLGWVTSPDNDYAQAAFWFDDHDWTITVKYNPEED